MVRYTRLPVLLLLGGCGLELAEVEPGEHLPGGGTTNTLWSGGNAFNVPAENLSEEHSPLFYAGNGFFNQAWVQAPSSTEARDGLGPLFNARSCAACHFKDGRARPPEGPDDPALGILFRLSVPGPAGPPTPEPTYGGQLQPFGILGVPGEGRFAIATEDVAGAYADGTPYTLRRPRYTFADLAHGPLDPATLVSPRTAPAMIGLGLLEAIPAARLEALADPEDRDGDGVSGRPNRVPDVARGDTALGRFGWKAEQPTVRQQSAGAFLGDMGLTTELFPSGECEVGQRECGEAISGGRPEVSAAILDRVEVYGRLLAVPGRRDAGGETVRRGKRLFGDAGCDRCHVPRHETGVVEGFPELSGQVIWPYTDLLLHDLGEVLADGRPTFAADGREWRTPPLWGVGLVREVNGHDRLLHDGRARGVAEAVLWHGGEAESAREAFRAMPADDRAALVAFVESL